MRDDCMREKEMSVRPPLVKEQLEPRASLLIPSSSVTRESFENHRDSQTNDGKLGGISRRREWMNRT